MSEHHIPQPAGWVVHVPRVDCPCGTFVTVGRRGDGSFGVIVVHRDDTDPDRDEEFEE